MKHCVRAGRVLPSGDGVVPMGMSTSRESYIRAYTRDVFGAQDDHLAGLMVEGVAAGLPDIAVSPDVGRLLLLLAKMVDAKCIVEVGTLGGYSAIWLARGLAPGGRLITIEKEPHHADFAREQFKRAGVSDRVDVRVGTGLDLLPGIAAELGPNGADLIFFDAIKREYPEYWAACRTTLRPGGLLVADNILGAGWWIDEVGHPDRDAVDAFSRAMAGDPTLDCSCIPLREGLLVARKTTEGGP